MFNRIVLLILLLSFSERAMSAATSLPPHAEYLESLNVDLGEGHINSEHAAFFREFLLSHPEIKRIAEIGFNAGHSSDLMLSIRPDIEIVAFDLCEHAYVNTMKEYIDQKFPGRHTLIRGDTRHTLPSYFRKHPEEKFDLIFIDGGHTFGIAHSDLRWMHEMARPDTVVIMDDMQYYGPRTAWEEYERWGRVQTDAILGSWHKWAVGKYLPMQF